jgi:CBS domain-containing protein
VVTALALGASVETAVGAHMTPAPATAELGEDSVAVANRMLDLGVRHLPPVEGGQVVGRVSATDLLSLVAWPERPPNDRVALYA